MRKLVKPRQRVIEVARKHPGIYRARLAEPYDGVGQYVLVALAGSSIAAAYKARVAAGDFGGGRTFPRGTPVTVVSNRGQLEVFLGNIPKRCSFRDDFNREVAAANNSWGVSTIGPAGKEVPWSRSVSTIVNPIYPGTFYVSNGKAFAHVVSDDPGLYEDPIIDLLTPFVNVDPEEPIILKTAFKINFSSSSVFDDPDFEIILTVGTNRTGPDWIILTFFLDHVTNELFVTMFDSRPGGGTTSFISMDAGNRAFDVEISLDTLKSGYVVTSSTGQQLVGQKVLSGTPEPIDFFGSVGFEAVHYDVAETEQLFEFEYFELIGACPGLVPAFETFNRSTGVIALPDAAFQQVIGYNLWGKADYGFTWWNEGHGGSGSYSSIENGLLTVHLVPRPPASSIRLFGRPGDPSESTNFFQSVGANGIFGAKPVEFEFSFRVSRVPTTDPELLVIAVDWSNGIPLELDISNSGTAFGGRLLYDPYGDSIGTEHQVAKNDWVANRLYFAKFRFSPGSYARAKVWDETESEPDWQINRVDSAVGDGEEGPYMFWTFIVLNPTDPVTFESTYFKYKTIELGNDQLGEVGG